MIQLKCQVFLSRYSYQFSYFGDIKKIILFNILMMLNKIIIQHYYSSQFIYWSMPSDWLILERKWGKIVKIYFLNKNSAKLLKIIKTWTLLWTSMMMSKWSGGCLLNCYKLVHGFRVTCLFTGQYNTKGYDTITEVI